MPYVASPASVGLQSGTSLPSSDRRLTVRHSLSGNVEFDVNIRGQPTPQHGHMVNLSTGGMLFETESPPHRGAAIQLRVPWPATATQDCHLSMRIEGKVVRTTGHQVAVMILRYEFEARTRQ